MVEQRRTIHIGEKLLADVKAAASGEGLSLAEWVRNQTLYRTVPALSRLLPDESPMPNTLPMVWSAEEWEKVKGRASRMDLTTSSFIRRMLRTRLGGGQPQALPKKDGRTAL